MLEDSNPARAVWLWSKLLILTVLAQGCMTSPPSALSRYEFTQPQMGVPFRIVLYAPDEASGEAASTLAFARIKQLNDIMSDYETDSELSQLSRTAGQGKAVKVSDDLWIVLSRAQRLATQSDGAFDVTVGPCVSLWRKARREKQMPDAALLAEARAAVSYKNLHLNPKNQTAKLVVSGMRLDLGGIAKGYAVDEALKILCSRGITRALVSGGGDLAVADAPVWKKGWRIEIAPLDAPDAPPKQFVLLRHAGLATSGDMFQHLEIDGHRYSHIVDPHTCVGLTDHSLVTVIAKDCITADGLSTAVSVLGPTRGMKLIAETAGTAVHVVRRPEARIETYESSRFKEFYEPMPKR